MEGRCGIEGVLLPHGGKARSERKERNWKQGGKGREEI